MKTLEGKCSLVFRGTSCFSTCAETGLAGFEDTDETKYVCSHEPATLLVSRIISQRSQAHSLGLQSADDKAVVLP
jgi:hypothetical protein